MKTLILTTLALAASTPAFAQAGSPQVDRAFAAMDADKNGQISKAEFARAIQARHDKQAKALDAGFVEMDKNKDGKVSKEEATANPVIASAFDGLDANHDGSLSQTELRSALSQSQAMEMSGQ